MKRKQRKINAEQKVIILRELLENDRSVSQLSEEYGVNPNLIYRWKKQLFEEAVEIFKPKSNKDETKKDREIKKLKEQLTKKETAISYLLNDNIALKKNLGEI
jgi:transposase-like protein